MPRQDMPRQTSLKARFMQFVNKAGCWLWTSGTDARGYGMFWANGKSQRAHRVSYKIHRGPIPAGLKVLHKCDVPSCVNPNHLFIGTSQDNTDDMRIKGREGYAKNPPRGSRQWKSKLTREMVSKIRSDDRPQSVIANEYGITQPHVSKLKSQRRWQHI